MKKPLFFFLLFTILLSCKKAENINYDYFLDDEWNNAVHQLGLGQVVGLDIASNGDIVVFHRAGRMWTEPFPEENIENNTIAIIDSQSGKIKKSWGKNLFSMPHGLTVDHYDNVWVTDVGRHQVFKFNAKGELLMMLGEERMPGVDALHFDQPTDIAISEVDSSVYISDGYGNSRVVKYNYQGKYLLDFGSKGNGKGLFNLPHGITIDPEDIIYVADRENSRVQSFDAKGNFLKVWDDKSYGKVYSVAYNHKEKVLLAVDYKTNLALFPVGSDIIFLKNDGSYTSKIGRSGNYEGKPLRYHDLAIDNNGYIYIGDILENQLIRYKKK